MPIKRKIVFVDQKGVGKTALVNWLLDKPFDEKSSRTIGVKSHTIIQAGKEILLVDLTSDEYFILRPSEYLNDSTCFCFVFDESDPRSLDELEHIP